MKIWYGSTLGSRRSVLSVEGDRVRLGRGADNDVVLDSPYVADRAAVLRRQGDAWVLTALGMNGCDVAGRRLLQGQCALLPARTPFRIFPFDVVLDPRDEAEADDADSPACCDEQMSKAVKAIHVELLDKMNIHHSTDAATLTDEYLLTLEQNLDDLARRHGIGSAGQAGLTNHVAGACVRGYLVEQLIAKTGQDRTKSWTTETVWNRLLSAVPHFENELARMGAHLWDRLGLGGFHDFSQQVATIERGYWRHWQSIVRELFAEFRDYLALRQLKKEIKDILFGFGPLEDLLRAPHITEIMVVNSERIYIEKEGVIENSGRRFISDEVTLSIIERIVAKVDRRIDKSKPLVDARLPDGSRVNAVIPPIAVSGPCLTIRKFPAEQLRMADLVAGQSLPSTAADFLRAAVLHRRNIVVSGGTGSGKTTLLNCLSDFIPNKERIVTIEDTAELRLQKDHVVRMETKQANAEGSVAYAIRDLVRNSLRMRPDRIVVGECRGAESLDMLQAMNTGHEGSLTTIHANSAADVVLRLEVMVQSASDLPISSIRRQIASAVDLIVHLARLRGGNRCVVRIAEVIGLDEDTGEVRLKDVFDADEQGCLRPTGLLPSFMDELLRTGMLDLSSFYQ
jgi:pilus assembly protein CpaF